MSTNQSNKSYKKENSTNQSNISYLKENMSYWSEGLSNNSYSKQETQVDPKDTHAQQRWNNGHCLDNEYFDIILCFLGSRFNQLDSSLFQTVNSSPSGQPLWVNGKSLLAYLQLM